MEKKKHSEIWQPQGSCHGLWVMGTSCSNSPRPKPLLLSFRVWNNTRLPRWCSSKKSACQCRRHRRCGFNPWVGKIPWRRKRQLVPVFLPEKSHGQRSLAGYSPRGRKESDMTERLNHDNTDQIDMYLLNTSLNSSKI